MNQIMTYLTQDFSLGITNAQVFTIALLPIGIIITALVLRARDRREAI